jgi:hypothetical protein
MDVKILSNRLQVVPFPLCPYSRLFPPHLHPLNFPLAFRSTLFRDFTRRGRGRYGSVGIETYCGLDGPGIESRWGRDFSHPSRPALGPTQPPILWLTGLSPGVKRPGRGVDHSPSSCAEIEGRVELCVCSPSGPSCPVLGWPLHLPLRCVEC